MKKLKPRIIKFEGVAFDLSQVKCFRFPNHHRKFKENIIVVELKTDSEDSDNIEIRFSDWDSANTTMQKMEREWESYLEDNL